MMWSRLVRAVSVLLFISIVFSAPIVSAGWVDGYYKSDGTYVNGYWKSNPNGLKYDNYSFDGNWADAFNDSYYSPTKNYSSNWYTPTWVTQDDYWVGKSFYDTRNSYSTYSTNQNDYSYKFWDDPIYSYKPTYNYGYNYLDSFNDYKSSYFDYDSYSTYKPYSSSYTSPYSSSYNTYNSYSTPSYTTPTYNSYNSYTTPSYNSYDYSTPSYTSPSYDSYSSTCYSYYSC